MNEQQIRDLRCHIAAVAREQAGPGYVAAYYYDLYSDYLTIAQRAIEEVEAERDSLRAAIATVNAKHYQQGPTTFHDGTVSPALCMYCRHPWPCETSTMLGVS